MNHGCPRLPARSVCYGLNRVILDTCLSTGFHVSFSRDGMNRVIRDTFYSTVVHVS